MDVVTLRAALSIMKKMPDTAASSAAAAEEAQAAAEAAAERAEGAIEVDDTLSVEGRAADSKAVGGEITGLKADLSEMEDSVVLAYDSLGPYLYKRNVFLASNLEEVELEGYNLYKIPLGILDVLHIAWTDNFYGTLSFAYVFNILLDDGTMERPNGGTRKDCRFAEALKQGFFFGQISNVSNIKAVYISAKSDSLSYVKVALNKPFTQLTNDVTTVYALDSVNTIQMAYYFRTNNATAVFNSPYFSNMIKMKPGDRIVINKAISGLSGKANIVKADGSTEAINSSDFTVTEECVACVFDNSDVDGNIVFYPANGIKISPDNIIGEIETSKQFEGLSGVAFGTSLTYRAQTTGGYLQYLPSLSGITFDNQGLGSSTILPHSGNPQMLPKITDYTEYDGKRVCILEGFVNDFYYNGAHLGTWKDTTQDTVCGCVRYAINHILTQNPNLTVFLVMDHFGNGITAADALNDAGQTQLEFYQEIEKVGLSMGVRIIREYELSEISQLTPQYLLDNIHLNALGAEQSAKAIWSGMKATYPNILTNS